MAAWQELEEPALKTIEAECEAAYETYKARGLKLDMSRGKPGPEQLDLTLDMLDCVNARDGYRTAGGADTRNYGIPDGIPEARALLGAMMGVPAENVIVGGNSSLNMMFDYIATAYSKGVCGQEPWCRQGAVKFLCPAPGYDRHFKVTESFGFELVTIPMTDEGPDMDAVEKAIQDPAVKGMWNVPKYSHPDGIIYSAETIRRIASMKPAAPDFLLMWDNAYCIHEFEGDYVEFPDILAECEKYGNADMVFEFASTSKVTLPGAGISCFACSEANMAYMEKLLTVQVISFDKVNQQRHVLYLKDKAHTLELMKKHAAIMGPKFRCVVDALDREIAPLEIASWRRPKGGYFVSLNAMPGTAKRTLALCKEAGVTMTGAGATFPYGKDPQDSNIRIAPSLPPVEELEQAIAVLCVCLKMAALEKLGV